MGKKELESSVSAGPPLSCSFTYTHTSNLSRSETSVPKHAKNTDQKRHGHPPGWGGDYNQELL